MKRKANLIDMLDQEAGEEAEIVENIQPPVVPEAVDLEKVAVPKLSSKDMKTIVNRLLTAFPFNTEGKIKQQVRTYSLVNPQDRDVANIVKQVSVNLEAANKSMEDTQEEEDNYDEPDDENEEKDDEEEEEVYVAANPVAEVLRVLPNAKRAFVEKLLKAHGNHVNNVVQEMLEKGFEKEEAKKEEKEIDFTSTSWETTPLYRQNAAIELENNFPFLRVANFGKLLAENKNHYFATYKFINDITQNVAQYDESTNKLSTIYNTTMVAELRQKCSTNPLLMIKIVAKSCKRKAITPIDPTFEREITWLQKKQHNEREIADQKFAEELNMQEAEDEGALIECGCCCGDYPFDSLVQCTEGHLFCKQCLQRYVEQTVFGDGRSVLKCMNTTGDVCEGHFSDEMIGRSLSAQVFAKYSEAQTRDALKAAKIDNLMACYNCTLQVEVAEDAGNVLNCPSCSKSTCRLCGEESHVPLKCSEVEKKGATNKRLILEEALSQARVRECPKCKTRFYKTEGCNKMTCTCNCLSCYICRADVSKVGYAHFCQTPNCDHKACGKCKLFTDTVEDDRQAMLDAGLKAMEGEGEDGAQVDEAEKKEQLAKLLEGGIPVKGAKKPAAAPAFPAFGGGFGGGGGGPFGFGVAPHVFNALNVFGAPAQQPLNAGQIALQAAQQRAAQNRAQQHANELAAARAAQAAAQLAQQQALVRQRMAAAQQAVERQRARQAQEALERAQENAFADRINNARGGGAAVPVAAPPAKRNRKK